MAGITEVYDHGAKLREACEKAEKRCMLAVPVNFSITRPPSGRRTTAGAMAGS